jgi:hypothetical protein
MKGKRNAASCVLLKRKQLIGALLQTYEKKVERIEKPIDFINFNLNFNLYFIIQIYSILFYSGSKICLIYKLNTLLLHNTQRSYRRKYKI